MKYLIHIHEVAMLQFHQTSPTEGLDDTGLACHLRQKLAAQEGLF